MSDTVTSSTARPAAVSALPQTYVDIYPFEGGKYTFTGMLLLSTTTSKNLGEDAGTFSVTLSAGGPNGLNMPPSWAEIITPMSTVVIGARRAGNQAITMIGVVRTVQMGEVWVTGQSVQRGVVISGVDFGYYFTMFTYYSLWYLGAIGTGVSPTPSAGLPQIFGAGLISGNPGTIGNNWFNQIMAGDKGLYAKTVVPFKNSMPLFTEVMSYAFENYDVEVPYGENFVNSEGAWIEKFKQIFPFPFYEFFIITATSIGQYTGEADNIGNAKTAFSSGGLGDSITASPTVVARKNVLPTLTTENSGAGFSLTGIDTEAWDSLPRFRLEGGDSSFLQSAISFDESMVYNFYALNPTWMRSLLGAANSGIVPAVFTFSAAADQGSINRYGFRPANISFNWMADLDGTVAAQGKSSQDIDSLAATLIVRFLSYYHPTSLMASASVTTWLRPDIIPGGRFTYQPFKNEDSWDFYITGVAHSYVFGGGQSTTTLTLTRGLPTAVYQDKGADGLLFKVHTGQAVRKDGIYQAGTGPGITVVSQAQFQDFLSNWTPVYATPQGL